MSQISLSSSVISPPPLSPMEPSSSGLLRKRGRELHIVVRHLKVSYILTSFRRVLQSCDWISRRIWNRPSSTCTGCTTGLCFPCRTLCGISWPRFAASCGTWFWGRRSRGEIWGTEPDAGEDAPVGWALSRGSAGRATMTSYMDSSMLKQETSRESNKYENGLLDPSTFNNWWLKLCIVHVFILVVILFLRFSR